MHQMTVQAAEPELGSFLSTTAVTPQLNSPWSHPHHSALTPFNFLSLPSQSFPNNVVIRIFFAWNPLILFPLRKAFRRPQLSIKLSFPVLAE